MYDTSANISRFDLATGHHIRVLQRTRSMLENQESASFVDWFTIGGGVAENPTPNIMPMVRERKGNEEEVTEREG